MDYGNAIAVTGTTAFVTGSMEASSNLPATDLGLGGNEAFVARIAGLANSIGFFDLSFTAAEGDGTATITVSRYGSATGAVSANYTTSAGTATAGTDYTETSGTLNWADGDAQDKTFTIPLVDDDLQEEDETVYVVFDQRNRGRLRT